jgi:hypothetical protein
MIIVDPDLREISFKVKFKVFRLLISPVLYLAAMAFAKFWLTATYFSHDLFEDATPFG